jgi:hypothetical protein
MSRLIGDSCRNGRPGRLLTVSVCKCTNGTDAQDVSFLYPRCHAVILIQYTVTDPDLPGTYFTQYNTRCICTNGVCSSSLLHPDKYPIPRPAGRYFRTASARMRQKRTRHSEGSSSELLRSTNGRRGAACISY